MYHMKYHAAKKVQTHTAAAGNTTNPPHRKFLLYLYVLF